LCVTSQDMEKLRECLRQLLIQIYVLEIGTDTLQLVHNFSHLELIVHGSKAMHKWVATGPVEASRVSTWVPQAKIEASPTIITTQ
jgi:hypothetical protein